MPPVVKKFDKRWLAPSGEAVDGDIFRLLNNQALTAWDSAKESAVQLMKLDASSKLQLLVIPQLSSNRSISADNDLIDKKYLVDAIDAITTSVIEEGSNLYFTDARAKSSAVIDFAAASLIGSQTNMAASVSGMKLYVQKKMDDLVNGAPGTLDTLKEIADQLAADESVASALNAVVGSNYTALGQRITDLTTTNIAEGINLYFTAVRATDAAVVDSTAGSEMVKAASVKSMKSYVRGEIDALSTSDIEEGSRLYFTAVRATDAAVVDSTAGSEMVKAASVKSMKSYVRGEIDALSTSDIEEGSRLYFTDVRATDAAVVNSTAGSQTTKAPSVSAVNSALSLKQDIVTVTGPLVKVGVDLSMPDSSASVSGYLSSTNFSAFEKRALAMQSGSMGATYVQTSTSKFRTQYTVTPSAAGNLNLAATDVAYAGIGWYFRNAGTAVATFVPSSGQLINGAATLDLLPGEVVAVVSTGSGWVTIGNQYAARIDALTTSNIAEGSRLYFTDARAKSSAVIDFAAASLIGSQTNMAASVSGMKLYVQKKMDDLVNGAPGTLDTLKEIADQLAADESVASALNAVVGSNYTALGQRITDLTTSNIAEGSRLYFTDVRATDAAVVDSTAGSEMVKAASVKSMKSYVRGEIDALSTSDIEEGSRLYFTDARAKSSAVIDFAAASLIGSQTDMAASVAGMKLYVQSQIQTKDNTDEIAEGSNLYFTDARAKSSAVIDFAAASLIGSQTNMAASVAGMKLYIASELNKLDAPAIDLVLSSANQVNWPLASGESFPVNVKEALDYLALNLKDLDGQVQAIGDDVSDLLLGDSGIQLKREKFTLGAGDISNGYIELTKKVKGDGIMMYVNRIPAHMTDDFTMSTQGSGAGLKTRLTFAGDLASAGQAAVISGDVVYVTYGWVTGDYPSV